MSRGRKRKESPAQDQEIVPDPVDEAPEQDKDHVAEDQPVASPVKESVKPVYRCVLAIKENAYKAKPGDEYEGEGLKNPDRLAHLLKRGAVKAA